MNPSGLNFSLSCKSCLFACRAEMSSPQQGHLIVIPTKTSPRKYLPHLSLSSTPSSNPGRPRRRRNTPDDPGHIGPRRPFDAASCARPIDSAGPPARRSPPIGTRRRPTQRPIGMVPPPVSPRPHGGPGGLGGVMDLGDGESWWRGRCLRPIWVFLCGWVFRKRQVK